MRKTPVAASFDITFRCNLHCVMCHTWVKEKEIGEKDELSTVEIVGTARHLRERYGVEIIRFMGGEPLLREDLPEIVREVSQLATTLITTNGVLLDEPMSRALIEAGLSGVSVSLDGPRENCDALRGSGTWDRAVAGLRVLLRVRDELDNSLDVNIGNVVTKLNLDCMGEAAGFAEELGIDWYLWPMNHLHPIAEETEWNGVSCGFDHPAPGKAGELVLDDAELTVFWKEYYRLARRTGRPGSRRRTRGWLGPLKQIALHKAFNLFYRDCQRVGKHLIIGPDGEILPCEFLRSITLGNVMDRDREIWETPARRALEKGARSRSLPVCRECHRLALYRRHF